jgi:ketosteroid isomerase-like protein
MPHAETIRAYLAAIEAAADIAPFFTPDAEQREFPNRLNAKGQQRDFRGLLEGAEKGKAFLVSQHYDIHAIVESGDRVAVEATWTGRMTFPMGKTPAGEPITAHFAMFFEMRDGKIWRQRNYDCFAEF